MSHEVPALSRIVRAIRELAAAPRFASCAWQACIALAAGLLLSWIIAAVLALPDYGNQWRRMGFHGCWANALPAETAAADEHIRFVPPAWSRQQGLEAVWGVSVDSHWSGTAVQSVWFPFADSFLPQVEVAELPAWSRVADVPSQAGAAQFLGGRTSSASADQLLIEDARGWPAPSWMVVYVDTPGGFSVEWGARLPGTRTLLNSVVPNALPTRPVAGGLAIDVAVLGLGCVGVVNVLRLLRRRRRRALGLCERCCHSLHGARACPECGSVPGRHTSLSSPPN